MRDIVRAYVLAVDLEPGVYNICSDQNVTMQEIMDKLIENAKVPVKTKVNPALFRPADFSFKTPSCEKFQKLTDWKPVIGLDITMIGLLDYWRKQCES